MRVSSGRARATKLISDVFFVLRTVRAVLAFVDPHLKRSIPRSLESLRTLLSTYGGSLKNVYLPDNARLEEEEEQYEMSGGEGDADEQKLQGAVEPQGAVDPLQPQPPATAEVPPPLQSNPDPQNVPQTTAQADAQPAKAAGQTQRSGDKEAEAEEQEEQPPNECAELINAYEARVREHCAALDEAIEHVRQNAAPVLEKVHAWKEAAGAFSRQMAEQQVVRDELATCCFILLINVLGSFRVVKAISSLCRLVFRKN